MVFNFLKGTHGSPATPPFIVSSPQDKGLPSLMK